MGTKQFLLFIPFPRCSCHRSLLLPCSSDSPSSRSPAPSSVYKISTLTRVFLLGISDSGSSTDVEETASGREMARRCSHCNHNGHNSRTCPNRGVKLFGVHLTDGSVRKSASMGNLSLLAGSSGGASPADGPEPGGGAAGGGYASEDFVKGSSSSCRERKKGEPPLIFHTFCLPFFLGLVKDVSFIRIDIFSSIIFFIAFQRLLLYPIFIGYIR